MRDKVSMQLGESHLKIVRLVMEYLPIDAPSGSSSADTAVFLFSQISLIAVTYRSQTGRLDPTPTKRTTICCSTADEIYSRPYSSWGTGAHLHNRVNL